MLMDENTILSYVCKHFPTESTEKIAQSLGLNSYVVRKIAKEHNINKSPEYLHGLSIQLTNKRRKWYEQSIPTLTPTFLQEQIIYGSLLGDGYISTGADRSINCYYQEHFSPKQLDYRKWKLDNLRNLGFSIKGNYLRSTSHPYFTKLQKQLYKNGRKIVTKEFLKRCNHLLFLTSLYLDDGSLIISTRYNKNKHVVYCSPSIIIYTLNFTFDENTMLANHLNNVFKTNFVISGHPDGNGYLLKLNKERDVSNFLKLLEPHTKNIPSMFYKTILTTKIEAMEHNSKEKYGKDIVIKTSSSQRCKPYSKTEINTLIEWKKQGKTDVAIAEYLNRSYWSVVYKLVELRKNHLL